MLPNYFPFNDYRNSKYNYDVNKQLFCENKEHFALFCHDSFICEGGNTEDFQNIVCVSSVPS